MKKIIFLFAILLNSYGSKANSPLTDTVGKNITVLVKPNQTDPNYASTDQSHYVVRNTKKHLNKLLLFIGGSFSIPKNYYLICNHGATIGLDVISLSYPNNVAAAPLGKSNDPLIFDNYRDELCFGNQVSSAVSVDVLNSITTRATKLLLFLKATYPDQNWDQYLSASNTIIWSKVIVAGHSQGSGHACYIGKKNLVDRVVMFSGPNDFSTHFNSPANWLIQKGKTPNNKNYALLHTQDEIVPFANQVENLKGLGLLTSIQNPTLADNLSLPYSNSHVLSLNIPAISYHNSPIGANSKLPNIWTYLFTAN
jgi:hypothetical protein